MRKFCVKQNLIKYKEKICLYPHHSELVEDSDRNPSCAWCGYRLDFSASLAMLATVEMMGGGVR